MEGPFFGTVPSVFFDAHRRSAIVDEPTHMPRFAFVFLANALQLALLRFEEKGGFFGVRFQ